MGSRSEATTVVSLLSTVLEFVVGLRSHTGEVLSVYLTDVDVEKLIEFLTRKHD